MKKGEEKRRIWHHNSFFGHARMAEANMFSIIRADSTTPEAKATAEQIAGLARKLRTQLKTRIDR